MNLFIKWKQIHRHRKKLSITKGERVHAQLLNHVQLFGINIYILLLLSRFSHVRLCATP